MSAHPPCSFAARCSVPKRVVACSIQEEDVEGADAPDIVEEYQLSDDEEDVDDGMDFAGGSGSEEGEEEDADDEQPAAADSASDDEEV